jgi:hypothetical protein
MRNPNYEYSDRGRPMHCDREMAKNGAPGGKQRWRCKCGDSFREDALEPHRPPDGAEAKTEAERSGSYYQRMKAAGYRRLKNKWVKD